MATYVLVHGGWAGGWIWRDVADRLRAGGHRVFVPTLTGLGERSHLISKQITLSTHVLDVVNLIKWEELSDIVLVGQSYGGMVITGVTEKVPDGAIGSIVYLEAFLPGNGQSLADLLPAEGAPPEASLDPMPFPGRGRTGNAWIERLVTPQPRGTLTEPLALTGALDRIKIKTYVVTTKYPMPGPTPFSATAQRLAKDPAWRMEEIASGHDMMVEMPDETAQVLLRAAP
jgi:pimeloyl-ACP methyl ester carboxylesterase